MTTNGGLLNMKFMRTCPTGAIVWDSRRMDVQELFEEILKDEPFFHHGGGVTLSGGEPLLQSEFAAALLTLLQERKINTAMQAFLAAKAGANCAAPYVNRIDNLGANGIETAKIIRDIFRKNNRHCS